MEQNRNMVSLTDTVTTQVYRTGSTAATNKKMFPLVLFSNYTRQSNTVAYT